MRHSVLGLERCEAEFGSGLAQKTSNFRSNSLRATEFPSTLIGVSTVSEIKEQL